MIWQRKKQFKTFRESKVQGNIQFTSRTVVFEVSTFVGNPVGRILEKNNFLLFSFN